VSARILNGTTPAFFISGVTAPAPLPPPATVPCVIDDLPAEDYHRIVALSASALKRIKVSELHLWAAQFDPERVHGEPTPAMKNGTRTHCAALEPSALAGRYLIRPPEIDGRSKEGKAWLANVPASVEVCTVEEMAASQAQAASLRAHPVIGPLLAAGKAECSAFWLDPATGVLCKCRPDWLSPAGNEGGVIIVDIKTAIDASPAGFAKAVANWVYHLQAAHYSDGYALATGKPVLGFLFAVVESSPPYAAAAYMLDDETLDKARAINAALGDRYATALRTDTWPGYPEEVGVLSLPPWAF
jgi:exodeoxyribonuclease VIII